MRHGRDPRRNWLGLGHSRLPPKRSTPSCQRTLRCCSVSTRY